MSAQFIEIEGKQGLKFRQRQEGFETQEEAGRSRIADRGRKGLKFRQRQGGFEGWLSGHLFGLLAG